MPIFVLALPLFDYAAVMEDPEAFRALCEIPVEFRNKDRHSDDRRLAPIIALDAKVDRGAAFASKPAPTLDRVPKLECSQMWERACSRRGQHSHHKPQQKKPRPAVTGSGQSAWCERDIPRVTKPSRCVPGVQCAYYFCR
ncbi:hypothetical protein PspR76_28850 [Pseudomonas sp. R76]|nr:hypothetical protein PspR76_28850 [Pseudomonas sp. R76]